MTLTDHEQRLSQPCPRGCGRTVGEHRLPFSDDDCTWTNDAKRQTYDGAGDRYHFGLWSLDQWEAFQRCHTYSKHKLWAPATAEVQRFINLLQDDN